MDIICNNQVVKPLKIRNAGTKNAFIVICWKWLQDMKTLQPYNVWNDLIFAKFSAPHSLTRRLGIALHCKEIVNDDATNILPDRYRKYWKNHPEYYNVVFSEDEPDLILPPPPYDLPTFSLNHPYPTIESTRENQNEFMEGIVMISNLH